MNESPTISVLMPVYNAEAYVAEAVESILAQTWSDFEFLIVDDGSTDRSREKIDQLATTDTRIRFRSRPNTGIVGALNEMLATASGTYLARMDADDIADPTRFQRQLEYLMRNEQCVAVGSSVRLIDPTGLPIRLEDKLEVIEHAQIVARLLQGRGDTLRHPTAMLRTSAVRECGGYREEYRLIEDIDLFLRLARFGKLANLPETLLSYRLHPASTNCTQQSKQKSLREKCIDENYRGINGFDRPADAGLEPFVESTHEGMLCFFGWNALAQGARAIAFKYGLQALFFRETRWEALKLLVCVGRGY